MNIYKAYLSQGDGAGCDYTIGCAKTVRNIEANSFEEATQKLIDLIEEEYSYHESRVTEAELYEVSRTISIPIEPLYQLIDGQKKEKEDKEKEEKERAEFERLNQKFGKTK